MNKPHRSGWTWISLLLRVALGAVFALSAYTKLGDAEKIQNFAFSVHAFEILPDHLVRLATFAIPWTEALCAACLILGLWTRSAAALVCVMVAIFIWAIDSVLDRGLSVSCGCFGKDFKGFCGETLSRCNIVQDWVLFGLAAAVAAAGYGRMGLDGCGRKAPLSPPKAA